MTYSISKCGRRITLHQTRRNFNREHSFDKILARPLIHPFKSHLKTRPLLPRQINALKHKTPSKKEDEEREAIFSLPFQPRALILMRRLTGGDRIHPPRHSQLTFNLSFGFSSLHYVLHWLCSTNFWLETNERGGGEKKVATDQRNSPIKISNQLTHAILPRNCGLLDAKIKTD